MSKLQVTEQQQKADREDATCSVQFSESAKPKVV